MDKNKILKEVKRLSPWYQGIELDGIITTHIGDATKHINKTNEFLDFFIPKLKSDDIVLDLGSNAGLFTIEAALKCKKAIGIELKERNWVAQSRLVRRVWEENYQHDLSDAHFVFGDIMDHLYLIDDVTVILTCKFFHHEGIRPNLNTLLHSIKHSKVERIFLQLHTLENTYGVLGTMKGNVRLLKKCGFVVVDQNLENAEYPILEAQRK